MNDSAIAIEDFDAAMADADNHLRDRGVAIPARPLQAIPVIAELLKISAEIPINGGPIDGEISAATLYSHVNRWYQEHYGERLKTRLGPGAIAVHIRGEAWKATLPLVYGSVEFTIDRRLSAKPTESSLRVNNCGAMPRHNVLDSIQLLPTGLAASLRDDELRGVFEEFIFAFQVLGDLVSHCRNDVLLRSAFTDLDVAVDKLCGDSPDYGLSRWSSLQFTEKALKSALQRAGMAYSKTHMLNHLAKVGADAGVFALAPQWLSDIQCSAGIRYGEQPTSLEEAMTAHRSSIRAVSALSSSRVIES